MTRSPASFRSFYMERYGQVDERLVAKACELNGVEYREPVEMIMYSERPEEFHRMWEEA